MILEVKPKDITIKAKPEEVATMYFALRYFEEFYKGEYKHTVPIASDMAKTIFTFEE